MTRQCSLDLGFDRKGLIKYKNEDRVLLQYGFTVVGEPGNPVEVARRLRRSDRLKVTLYDLTGGHQVEMQSLSLSFAFQMARQQEHISPCRPPASFEVPSSSTAPLEVPFRRYRIYEGVASRGHTTVFEGEFPLWNVYSPEEGSCVYPENQLYKERMPPRKSFVLEFSGQFYLTILLDISWKDSAGKKTKKFRVDPEMIVDTNGPLGELVEH